MHRLIFIAGVPATGKTWLGNWLAETHGYVHINAEKDDGIDFDVAGVHDEWEQLVTTGRAETFVAALRGIDRPLVLTWGFPVQFLYVVHALSVAGMEPWWIRGDRRHARTAYVERHLRGEGPHPANFDPQMKSDRAALVTGRVGFRRTHHRWSARERLSADPRATLGGNDRRLTSALQRTSARRLLPCLRVPGVSRSR